MLKELGADIYWIGYIRLEGSFPFSLRDGLNRGEFGGLFALEDDLVLIIIQKNNRLARILTLSAEWISRGAINYKSPVEISTGLFLY